VGDRRAMSGRQVGNEWATSGRYLSMPLEFFKKNCFSILSYIFILNFVLLKWVTKFNISCTHFNIHFGQPKYDTAEVTRQKNHGVQFSMQTAVLNQPKTTKWKSSAHRCEVGAFFSLAEASWVSVSLTSTCQ